jgi:hypothetical protein
MDDAARDPDGERKKIADAFAEIHVKASDLVEYLGHSLDSCSPAELVQLRGLFGAIRDGEATWATVMDNKAETSSGDPAATAEIAMPKAKAKDAAPAEASAPTVAGQAVDAATGELMPREAASAQGKQSKPASEAQRKVIRGRAESRGWTEQELEAALVEKFGCTLATVPMDMVNTVLAFVQPAN